jgi:hypothetical protein
MLKGCLVGCGVTLLLLVSSLVIGGLLLWNRFGPDVQRTVIRGQQLERELRKIVPDMHGLDITYQRKNGVAVAHLSIPVGFDPRQGNKAANIARQIFDKIQAQMPIMLKHNKSFEVELVHKQGKLQQERVFRFGL